MPDLAGSVVLASACNFGWGSLGKLRLILEELDGITIALDQEASSTPVVRSMLAGRFGFTECARRDSALALVINDPLAADQITGCGVPVVYVDSLPFMWTTDQEVPADVAVYCAQKYPGSAPPTAGPLAGRHIRWIEPIVPKARRRRGGGGIVINVGGLHSHLVGAASDAYLRLVIFPLTAALLTSESEVDAICGNLPQWACAELAAVLPGHSSVGRKDPAAFEEVLSRASMLFTSPGSTTMLQAAALGVPTVLLPPQNLSQVLNTELYSSDRTLRIAWPGTVLDRAKLDELRPLGEDPALEYIYSAVVAASLSADLSAQVTAAITQAVTELPGDSYLPDDLAKLGVGGAGQVARIIRQAVLAPLPRPGKASRADSA